MGEKKVIGYSQAWGGRDHTGVGLPGGGITGAILTTRCHGFPVSPASNPKDVRG